VKIKRRDQTESNRLNLQHPLLSVEDVANVFREAFVEHGVFGLFMNRFLSGDDDEDDEDDEDYDEEEDNHTLMVSVSHAVSR
jgi:hypothetical protein